MPFFFFQRHGGEVIASWLCVPVCFLHFFLNAFGFLEQEAKFEGHGCDHAVAHKLGDLITLNCTMLNAGVTSDHGKTYALNVIPSTAEAGFDV